MIMMMSESWMEKREILLLIDSLHPYILQVLQWILLLPQVRTYNGVDSYPDEVEKQRDKSHFIIIFPEKYSDNKYLIFPPLTLITYPPIQHLHH